mgnify:CR=1 FL=1|jgi:hypothetical protein
MILENIDDLIYETNEIQKGMGKRIATHTIVGATLGISTSLAISLLSGEYVPLISTVGALGGFFSGYSQAANHLKKQVFGNNYDDVNEIDKLIRKSFISTQRFANKEFMNFAKGSTTCQAQPEQIDNMSDNIIKKQYKKCFIATVSEAIKVLTNNPKYKDVPIEDISQIKKLLGKIK